MALALERNVDLALSAIKVNRALYQARLLSSDLCALFSRVNASARQTVPQHRQRQRRALVPDRIRGELRGRPVAEAPQRRQRAERVPPATMEDRARTLALRHISVADKWFELKYLDESIKVMDASVKRYQMPARLRPSKNPAVLPVELPCRHSNPCFRPATACLICKIGRMWPVRRSGICSISAPVRIRSSAMPT